MGGVWGRRGATQTQRVERVGEHSASRTTCCMLLFFCVCVVAVAVGVVATASLVQLFIGTGDARMIRGPDRGEEVP